jgi:2'-5' RNA ligase
MRDWSRRRPRTTSILAIILSIAVMLALWRGMMRPAADNHDNPFRSLYRNDTATQCQETIYQPFLVGCPVDCRPYRKNSTDLPSANNQNETMYYRLTLEWYLGQAKLELHPPLPQPNTYYDMGKNYQCSNEFVDAFGRASDRLETALSHDADHLTFKPQTRMHISLAYLCCLTLAEAYHVREILQEFVHAQTTFRIPNVNFVRIECWKERFNSITHVIVVDNASQQRLLRLLQKLEEQIQQAGIPVPIARTTQMPFHSTLLGVQIGDKYSTDPQHNIDPIVPISFQALQDINRDIWPKNGIAFDITHLPKYSKEPLLQAAIG